MDVISTTFPKDDRHIEYWKKIRYKNFILQSAREACTLWQLAADLIADPQSKVSPEDIARFSQIQIKIDSLTEIVEFIYKSVEDSSNDKEQLLKKISYLRNLAKPFPSIVEKKVGLDVCLYTASKRYHDYCREQEKLNRVNKAINAVFDMPFHTTRIGKSFVKPSKRLYADRKRDPLPRNLFLGIFSLLVATLNIADYPFKVIKAFHISLPLRRHRKAYKNTLKESKACFHKGETLRLYSLAYMSGSQETRKIVEEQIQLLGLQSAAQLPKLTLVEVNKLQIKYKIKNNTRIHAIKKRLKYEEAKTSKNKTELEQEHTKILQLF